MAKGRMGGGVRRAGATVQKAEAPSPDTNEQFRSHCPSNRYQGRNSHLPPSSWVWTGRGRWDCSFRTRLTSRPGPRARDSARKRTGRPLGNQTWGRPSLRRPQAQAKAPPIQKGALKKMLRSISPVGVTPMKPVPSRQNSLAAARSSSGARPKMIPVSSVRARVRRVALIKGWGGPARVFARSRGLPA